MGYLMPYMRKYRKECILAPLFKMLEAGFDLMVPLVVANLVDRGIGGGDRGIIWRDVLLMAAMAVMGLLCSFTAQYFAARAAVAAGTGLRRQLLEHVQSLSMGQVNEIGPSTLLTRLTSDVNLVQNGCNMFLRLFLRSPFIVLGALILSFTVSGQAGLIFSGLIAVLFCIVFGVMALTNPLYRRQQEKLDRVTEATREDLSGVRVIRAFGREESQKKHFRTISDALLQVQKKAGSLTALMNPLTYVGVNGTIILILLLGAKWVHGGLLLSGSLIALINYVGQILIELVKLANLLVLLGKAGAGLQRISAVLDADSAMTFPKEETWEKHGPVLEMDNVSFTYEGASSPALRNISFTLEEGRSLGIIGSTGSGKTTLAQLLCRLYDPGEGAVLLWGRPLQQCSRETICREITMAEQKPVIFSGTVRSNLLWGRENAEEEALWNALTCACATDFVQEKGLDGVIEQGGRNLSGGQKQRLALARAILRNSAVLILDDSSSALDYGTDRLLQQNLDKLPCAKVVISQKISSVRRCDSILVLDEGMPAGQGTHQELMADCPVYQEIYESQFRKEVRS